MKTIILANAPINSGNRGCVALSYCAIYLIDKCLGEGNYRLYLTDSQEYDGNHSISVLGKDLSYESITLPRYNTLKGLFYAFTKMPFTLHSLSVFRKANYILDIGQGDSFADIYGKWRFDNIDFIHRISRLFKKPYAILPQTIGPFQQEENLKNAVKSIKKANLVMPRDKASQAYVNKLNPENKVLHEYIDVAFLLPFEKMHFCEDYTHVGINISALLWNGGYTKNNQFGLQCNYQTLCKELIDFFLKQPKTKVHLIPHVVSQERDVENDYEVSYELWREYNTVDLILAPFALGPIEIKSYIAGMDFFMGARMHSTIAAFSSGVPVVPMAYSRKFNGLFADTLQYPYIVDMKSMSDDVILSSISEAFENKRELKTTIEERLNGVVKERENLLYSELKSFLKK